MSCAAQSLNTFSPQTFQEAPGKGEQKGEGKVEHVPAVILLSRRIWSLLSGGTANGVL